MTRPQNAPTNQKKMSKKKLFNQKSPLKNVNINIEENFFLDKKVHLFYKIFYLFSRAS